MSDDLDSYQLGTPVVPGSDNFTAADPPGCSGAVDEQWLPFFGGSTFFPSPGCIFLKSGGRLSISNNSNDTIDFQFTNGLFLQNAVTVQPSQSVKVQANTASIAKGGTIIAVLRSNSNKSFQDVVVCSGNS
jgi:hypothetical protein